MDIKTWYASGRRFSDGCALLLQLGGSLDGLERWQHHVAAPPYPSDLLEKRLLALRHKAEAVPDSGESDTPARDVGFRGTPAAAQEPEIIQQLRAQGAILLKERAAVHGQMCGSHDERFRANCAHRIMSDLQPRIDETYAILKRWENSGELPVVASESIRIEERGAWKKINTLRSRISRIRGKLKAGVQDADYEKRLRAELAEKEAELQKLDP